MLEVLDRVPLAVDHLVVVAVLLVVDHLVALAVLAVLIVHALTTFVAPCHQNQRGWGPFHWCISCRS